MEGITRNQSFILFAEIGRILLLLVVCTASVLFPYYPEADIMAQIVPKTVWREKLSTCLKSSARRILLKPLPAFAGILFSIFRSRFIKLIQKTLVLSRVQSRIYCLKGWRGECGMKALISYSGDVAGFRKWLKKQKPDKVVFFRRRKGKRAPFRRKS